MKKSYFARLVCLVVAGLVLCSALAVAAVSGSPYETLKRSLFDFTLTENYTLKTDYRIYLDGEPALEESQLTLQGDSSTLNLSGGFLSYNSEEFNLNSWNGFDDGEIWYNAQSPGYQRYSSSFIGLPITSDTYSRFAELLLDLAVGDLKNNISMSQDGDIRNISGTLTAAQIPELYNAALDLGLSQMGTGRRRVTDTEVVSFDFANNTCVTKNVFLSGADKISEYYEYGVRVVSDPDTEGYSLAYGGRYYLFTSWDTLRTDTEPATYEDYADLYYAGSGFFDLPMPPPASGRFTYVHGNASVNSEGRLMTMRGTVSMDVTDIFGAKHTVELVFDIETSDIGTTSPECPISGVEELLASYAHEDARYSSIRFKLNEDGTIDTSSLFDNMGDVKIVKEEYGTTSDMYSDDVDEDSNDYAERND